MITFQKAYEFVMADAYAKQYTQTETVPLHHALHRILAEDARADRDIPAADVSLMDGFAYRREDEQIPLTPIEIIPAGKEPGRSIGKGECSRIMTGAIIPEGCDTVAMFENTRVAQGRVIILSNDSRTHIRCRAQDVKTDDIVLRTGKKIKPADIAVLAAIGKSTLSVVKKPLAGIIATGDEIVGIEEIPKCFQIRNSNSYQLAAQATLAGCDVKLFGIASDDKEDISEKVRNALDSCDLVLVTGGVSAGDFDYVPHVLKQAGVEPVFERIAIKPGQATVFGTTSRSSVFGLPGNPVSSYVIFELLVKPYIAKRCGADTTAAKAFFTMKETIKRKTSTLVEFRPVCFDNSFFVKEVPYHGSGHIHSFTNADGLVAFDCGKDTIESGTQVEVHLLG